MTLPALVLTAGLGTRLLPLSEVRAKPGKEKELRLATQIIDALVPFAVSPDFYVQDPLDDEAARGWMEENDPGQVVSESPLLLISGGRDGIVVPARTNALYDRLCDLGQVVQFVDLPEATHDSEPVDAADQISGWLADRLAGEPASSTCA